MYSMRRDSAVLTSREHVDLVPGFVAPELDGGLAERTDIEVHGVVDGFGLHELVPVAATPDELGVLAAGLELAESARRLKAVQSREQIFGVRAKRRYVGG